MAIGVDDSLQTILDCVSVALEDDEAPVCSSSTTVGNPVIANCCDCRGGQGELWGNLLRTYRADGASYADSQIQRRPCMPSNWAGEFQITLARCFPTLDDMGEVPSPDKRAAAAKRLHADIATMQRAINCCEVDGETVHLSRIGVDTDPSGGCSYLIAVVQVPVSMRSRHNNR